MELTEAVLATFWSMVAASALVLGGAMGIYAHPGRQVMASLSAFAAGTFIAVITFKLMEEAYVRAGLAATALSFLIGAIGFTFIATVLARTGRRHRRSPQGIVAPEHVTAIVIGIIIDSVPESIVVGLSLIEGSGISLATVIGIFISNVPEALSASAGLKAAGRSARSIFTLWFALMLLAGVCSLAGYLVFADLPPVTIAAIQAVAAGALLAMIADTMIPEAFSETHESTGLAAALGFLLGFALAHGLDPGYAVKPWA